MVALAIAANPAFELSRLELDRAGPSFSVDTLRVLAGGAARGPGGAARGPGGAAREPGESVAGRAPAAIPGRAPDLWFIHTAQAFADFLDWRDAAGILELSRLAVLPREGHAPADLEAIGRALPRLADRVQLLDGPRLRLSATEIRSRAARGLSVRYLVPDAVATYIGDHRLYREAAAVSEPATGGTIAT
jgi:nicotinate-nucleotide adenylyltransferase